MVDQLGGASSATFTQGTQQADQAQGGKSIGGKIASFFKALGSAIAAPFAKLAELISSAKTHDAKAAEPKKVEQAPFTATERQEMIDAAKDSAFFRSLGESTTMGLSVEEFDTSIQMLLSRPHAVAAMRDNGVGLEEAVAVSFYTSQAYVGINEQIRTGNETPEVSEMRAALEAALDKLPSFEGTVYRGSHLPKDVGLAHQEGATITATGIYSTTSDPGEAFRNINYSITINVKSDSGGADVTMFSDKPTEMEVIFPPGTQFNVESRIMSGREEYSHMHPPSIGGNPVGVVDLVMTEV